MMELLRLERRIQGACFKLMQWVDSPLIAEAFALREGLQFAWRLNYRHVEIENDYSQLIQMLRGKYRIPADVEAIVADIIHLTN
ncbi:hypothetical protein Leryth_026598 [Lithospermum erythrorhizon]|nr:hypothetical protein Leryth_026598 [Lithospermum erythrorhizon]